MREAPGFSFAPGDHVSRPFHNSPPPSIRQFDVAGPGLRFLGLIQPGVTDDAISRSEISVVLNWSEELKQRVK